MYTVLGAGGFVGSHLVNYLRSMGVDVIAPQRDSQEIFARPLGHVIYCIGLTADFRQRPFDTVHAHVSVLADILERADFASLLYLSSTRIYAKSPDTGEGALLAANPGDPSDLYNLSKCLGESLCLNCGRDGTRVARLSNVVGFDPDSDNFLSDLIRDALSGHIRLRSAMSSAKDYILLQDVVSLLPLIAAEGRERIYNVANGCNIENGAIIRRLQELTGCEVDVADAAPVLSFVPVQVERLKAEFRFVPANPLDALGDLVEGFRRLPAKRD